MLLSIPAILAVGGAAGLELHEKGQLTLDGDAAMVAGLSFIAAFISISFMMALLRRMSLMPFVIYRIVLGVVLLAWVYDMFGAQA
jgi:undecaprenyl-diphosphatase